VNIQHLKKYTPFDTPVGMPIISPSTIDVDPPKVTFPDPLHTPPAAPKTLIPPPLVIAPSSPPVFTDTPKLLNLAMPSPAKSLVKLAHVDKFVGKRWMMM